MVLLFLNIAVVLKIKCRHYDEIVYVPQVAFSYVLIRKRTPGL